VVSASGTLALRVGTDSKTGVGTVVLIFSVPETGGRAGERGWQTGREHTMTNTDPHSDRAELAPTRSSTRARRRRSGRLCLAFRISASARLCAVLVIAAATLAVGPGAAAAPPDKVSFPVDVSYPVDELAEFCGFDVWFSMVGTFKGTLFRDRTGTVVGEFDSQPNTRITFSSPTTGESFSYMFSTTFHSSYPEGLDPGDRVVSSVTGFLEKVPGLPASAGHVLFPDGEVVFVEDGVPYVNYGDPAWERGHRNDFDSTDAAICAALAS
jgi:hypothetical protein